MILRLQLSLLVALLSFCGCDNRKAEIIATIESSVPGTEVYYRAALLGKTPLSISQAMCDVYGFSIPDNQIVSDGWGEGIAFGVEDEEETKIMFLVPPADRSKYLSIETPWGVRTKASGAPVSFKKVPLRVKADFITLVDTDGVRLELHPVPTATPSEIVEIKVTITGTGIKPIEGFRPELMALWGTYDTPWRHRESKTMALDEKFSKISPGEAFDLSMPIRLPNVSGDYSLFVVFHLFKGEAGGDLAIGAVYSESRRLRIRQ